MNPSATAPAVREPLFRIARRDQLTPGKSILVRVLAILCALIVDALFIYLVTGLNPLQVYVVMFSGTFGNTMRLKWAVEEIAKRHNLTKDDIAWIIPHQANVRIETAVARRIGVPAEKVMINIDHMANTSGGTLPLCLWEYEPKLKRGDNLIFTAFGAGFTWGASYMKWAYDGSKYSK